MVENRRQNTGLACVETKGGFYPVSGFQAMCCTVSNHLFLPPTIGENHP